ncbi:uncharacterized protein EI90DRAFT_1011331 [Cantharellus anzutake]|uniref:uncharacterized protein n=1 Tax=Cantharellus anzutake TaxID=1750568 RepID=UPI001907AD1A|nr:uncharacterized protein EI90DRAFT_1011331 [Cantharellus anzutake]KAF8331343.1 hypothetical protein EI90DRAFT_1011331 [Cantharellus anzutake]
MTKRTVEQIRRYFSLQRWIRTRQANPNGPIRPTSLASPPGPSRARKALDSVLDEVSRDALEEEIILFPDLRTAIPQLRQLITKFPGQSMVRYPGWARVLRVDEERVLTWIDWTKNQGAPVLPSSSAPYSLTSTRPITSVSQPGTRLPTPSQSPEPRGHLRLSIRSVGGDNERSPKFTDLGVSSSQHLSLTTSPLVGSAPVLPRQPQSFTFLPSPAEEHVPSVFRMPSAVTTPVSPVTSAPYPQPRRVTQPNVLQPSSSNFTSLSSIPTPIATSAPSRSAPFVSVSNVQLFRAPVAIQLGNGLIGNSVPAFVPKYPVAIPATRGLNQQMPVPEPSPVSAVPPTWPQSGGLSTPGMDSPTHGLNELGMASPDGVPSQDLPLDRRSFNEFRRYVRRFRPQNEKTPSPSPPADVRELLRQLGSLGQSATDLLLQMRST